LATLERSLLAGLRALALTPQAAADLGLTWARTSALDEREFDPDRLSATELKQLRKLLGKARSSDD
jgi:N-acyl-D-aspartate/D-glutamate deacylase